jgi:signal transduction histidine kinase
MKIRTRLSLQFALVTASILLVSLSSIYLFSARYRQEQFYDRLMQRARNTARLLIEVSEVDHDLLKIIDRNTLSLPQESILIFNHNNDLIYSSQDEAPDLINSDLLDQIRLQDEVRFQEGRQEYLGILYADTFDRFVVIASASDIYGYSKLWNLLYILLAVFIGSMALVIAGGMWLAREALNPIARVVRQVDQISGNNLDARVEEGEGRDEISQLAATFNQMLARVEGAFQSQRLFVSHASHELRTPLTALTGQIEVSLMKERSRAEYEQLLESLLEDIRHLTQLSNGLLELAQIIPATEKMNMHPCRIDELIYQSRQEVLQRRSGANIQVAFDNFPEEENQLLTYGNPNLLQSAFANLLDNACKFSSHTPVQVKVRFDEQQAIVDIIDQGIGISEKDLPHIWDPFFRADNARRYQGHGLGLSLTHKILKLHQIEAEVCSQADHGTQIKLHIGLLNKDFKINENLITF